VTEIVKVALKYKHALNQLRENLQGLESTISAVKPTSSFNASILQSATLQHKAPLMVNNLLSIQHYGF